MTTYNEIKQEMKQELTHWQIDELRDNRHEWIDGYVPVYTNRIIEEWQEMPSEYNDRGALETFVHEDAGIVQRMSADLYIYYYDLVERVLTDLETELEEEGQE